MPYKHRGLGGTPLRATRRKTKLFAVARRTFFSFGAPSYIPCVPFPTTRRTALTPSDSWGYDFLSHACLYHVRRLDHRHNFSPYFYLIYLTYPSSATTLLLNMPLWRRLLRSPLTSFVPQMVLSLGTGLLSGRRSEDLVFTWFVQTVVFVVFNKVCTSQVSSPSQYYLRHAHT